jgi:hypothetical protein
MIRIASQSRSVMPKWHEIFLKMAPTIEVHAKIAFRHLRAEARAEAVQDVLCNACSALARLAELNKLDLAYPTVLARYAIAQVNDGRKVGCRLNVRDVSSPYCQRRKRLTVERLDHYDSDEEAWREVLIPDRTCTPAELAASRIDFPQWLDTLSRRDRKIAMILAGGETTKRTACKFHISRAKTYRRFRILSQRGPGRQGGGWGTAAIRHQGESNSGQGSGGCSETVVLPDSMCNAQGRGGLIGDNKASDRSRQAQRLFGAARTTAGPPFHYRGSVRLAHGTAGKRTPRIGASTAALNH